MCCLMVSSQQRQAVTLNPAHDQEETERVHGQVPAFASDIWADVWKGIDSEGFVNIPEQLRTDRWPSKAATGDEFCSSHRWEQGQR